MAGARAPKAELPKGFRDIGAEEIRATEHLLAKIREVYETYGFEPLDTPAVEYTEALGKFLPDQDRPNAGVFSFQDDDRRWLSLRYDLTAPLARYVAENYARLPKPFRRYALGPVWRDEKPGPGRFRQFLQFDADTVGTDSIAADAEMCMLAADTLEALGIPRGQYVIKVSNRKLIEGLLQGIDLGGEENAPRRLGVMRAIDKLDRLGPEGVKLLLGSGRKDESGDFTRGANLNKEQIDVVLAFLEIDAIHGPTSGVADGDLKDGVLFATPAIIDRNEKYGKRVMYNEHFYAGVGELNRIRALVKSAGYGEDRIQTSFSVVRGLEYYTGPVFEAELTFKITNEDGQPVRFGSVGGGGRYDDLIARFTGERVPATGFSLGVSRLQAALSALGRGTAQVAAGPVVVLVLDKERIAHYQKLTQRLRKPDDGGPPIAAELYLGTAGLKAQMKYADRRGSPCVVIQGSEERARGEVQIKDLIEGAKAAATIKDSREWRETRPAQFSVPEERLLAAVREVLARHRR
jgi:histidyl-tRNA synthetase